MSLHVHRLRKREIKGRLRGFEKLQNSLCLSTGICTSKHTQNLLFA